MKNSINLIVLLTMLVLVLQGKGIAKPTEECKIEHGDVLMRSLRVWPKDENDPHDTLATAKAFKVDKIVWIYENTAEFNKKVRQAGMGIGTTMADNARETWLDKLNNEQTEEFIAKYTIRNLKGDQVIPTHFEHFSNGYTAHFVPDMTIENWANIYTDYIIDLYNTGIDTIHRDDPASTAWAPRSGGTFTDSAVEYFRNYLQKNFDSQELKKLGVRDVTSFNVREHFLSLGAPTDNMLWQWRDSPLMTIYLDALEKANVDFFVKVRSNVEKATGRSIPWSRNGVGPYTDLDGAFDFRIGEYQLHHSQPQTLLIMSRYAANANKIQALISMVDGKWNEHPEKFIHETRKHISTAYAVGMIPLVPWCMYMHQAPRYYGDVEDFGDLYDFVSKNRELFDGYKLTAANGIDTMASLYSWQSNKELQYTQKYQRNLFWIDKENIFAFLRENKETSGKVVHLLNWNKTPESFNFSFSPSDILDSPAADLTIITEGKKNVTINGYSGGILNIEAISPWALMEIKPSKPSSKTIAAPSIISPKRQITAKGTKLVLNALDDNVTVYYRLNEEGDFKKYNKTSATILSKSGTLETYALRQSDNQKSDIVKIGYEVYKDCTVDDSVIASAKPAKRLTNSFNCIKGEMKVNTSFLAKELEMAGKKITNGISTEGHSLISCKVDPSWKYFTVKVGIDDAEDRRPCARLQIWFDNEVAYETPILNPSKLMICDIERVMFPIALQIPEGTSNIRLVSVPGGFFKEQNHIVWDQPTAYK